MACEVTSSDPSHSLPFVKKIFWTELNKSFADVFIELLMAYSDLCYSLFKSLFLSLIRIGIIFLGNILFVPVLDNLT